MGIAVKINIEIADDYCHWTERMKSFEFGLKEGKITSLERMINDTEQEKPAILRGNAYEHILGLRTVLLE